jgi:hypothetical protein
MSNENGTIWLVFKGEIYNHLNLVAELQSKEYIFRSHGDDEDVFVEPTNMEEILQGIVALLLDPQGVTFLQVLTLTLPDGIWLKERSLADVERADYSGLGQPSERQ